jgi:heme exporter protein C
VTRPAVPAPWSITRTWTLRVIGAAAVVSLAFTVWLGLWITPPDAHLRNEARLVYVHPPVAWVALYLAFGTGALASVLWLWPRTRSALWDHLAVAAIEVGTVFTALTLVTGSIWGRATWGVWWAWDARLTSTALLLVLELGYLAMRRVPADADARARRCAVVALVAAVDVPIVHFSVDWWNTLHQGGTFLDPGFQIHASASMAWTFLLAFVAFSLIFVWLLGVRYRIEVLEDAVGAQELEVSLAERWSEGSTPADAAELVGAGRGPEGSAP